MKMGVGALFDRSPVNRALTPILLTLLAACGTTGQVPKDDPRFARAVADTAVRAAVAKPGARVCREMRVGIAERDWVRGVVVSVEAPAIEVRIDDPGRYDHSLNDAQVRKGASVRDDPAAWVPCVGNP